MYSVFKRFVIFIVWTYYNLFNYFSLIHLQYFHFVAIIDNPVTDIFVDKPL